MTYPYHLWFCDLCCWGRPGACGGGRPRARRAGREVPVRDARYDEATSYDTSERSAWICNYDGHLCFYAFFYIYAMLMINSPAKSFGITGPRLFNFWEFVARFDCSRSLLLWWFCIVWSKIVCVSHCGSTIMCPCEMARVVLEFSLWN